MVSRTRNMNIRLTEEERARWLAAAEADGRTLTGLVKRAVEHYLPLAAAPTAHDAVCVSCGKQYPGIIVGRIACSCGGFVGAVPTLAAPADTAPSRWRGKVAGDGELTILPAEEGDDVEAQGGTGRASS